MLCLLPQTINYPVRLLEVQYRMHPDISMFPSKQFYNGRLQDWDGVLAQTQREWHQRRCFGPFVFYDVQVGRGGAQWCSTASCMLKGVVCCD